MFAVAWPKWRRPDLGAPSISQANTNHNNHLNESQRHLRKHVRPSPKTSPFSRNRQAAAGVTSYWQQRKEAEKEGKQWRRNQSSGHHPRAGHAGDSFLWIIILYDFVRVVALGLSAMVYEMAVGGAVYRMPFSDPPSYLSLTIIQPSNN